MISKNLYLVIAFLLLHFNFCARNEYDFFVKDFVAKTFHEDFKYFCITNSEGGKFLIKDKKLLEDAKLSFKEISSDMLSELIKTIRKGLNDRGLVPKTIDDFLKEVLNFIPLNHTKFSKKQYLQIIQTVYELINEGCLDFCVSDEIFDLVLIDLQGAILKVGMHFAKFNEINSQIEKYFINKKYESFFIIYKELKAPLIKFCSLILKEYQICREFVEFMKTYKFEILKALEETKTALNKKNKEIAKMSEEEYKNKNDMLGEARIPLYKLRDCNKDCYKLFNDCFDSAEMILKFFEEKLN